VIAFAVAAVTYHCCVE